MQKLQILQKLVHANFSYNSKELLSQIIRKEFDQTKDEDRALASLNMGFICKRFKLPEDQCKGLE